MNAIKGDIPAKIGDIVPYTNTHGNIMQAMITSFKEVSGGKIWFYGIDTVTNAVVWYPLTTSMKFKCFYEKQMQKEWINVNDRLPETDDDVLAFVEYDQFPITAYYHKDRWCVGAQVRDYTESKGNCTIDSVLHNFKVTHWMPLPPIPSTNK